MMVDDLAGLDRAVTEHGTGRESGGGIRFQRAVIDDLIVVQKQLLRMKFVETDVQSQFPFEDFDRRRTDRQVHIPPGCDQHFDKT